MKIGIFDSGIGGFSLLSELASRVADAEFIYYADSKNAPYGEKSEEEILKLSDRAIGFLTDQGAEAIVIACNTATAAAARGERTPNARPRPRIFFKPFIFRLSMANFFVSRRGNDRRKPTVYSLQAVRTRRFSSVFEARFDRTFAL